MAVIQPFRAIRPAEGLEERIAALPYDVYNSGEARAAVEREPLSFLRIDRPETQFPEGTNPYGEEVYAKACGLLWDMVKEGQLVQEEAPCYYIYELVWRGWAQDGIVACASVDDYVHGVIRKHENTRPEKEEDRMRHIAACRAQTGPIFLAYRQQAVLSALMEEVKREKPLYDFTASDGVTHRVWRVEDEERIARITEAFARTERLYIADGHHRAASAVKVSLQMREERQKTGGGEEAEGKASDCFLAVLFPDTELRILDYNRVVRDLNGKTVGELLEALEKEFEVERREEPVSPEAKGCFGMYTEGQWYALRWRGDPGKLGICEALDVSILQRRVLAPLFGIEDPKTDPRIDFVGGIRGLAELERRVREGFSVAFSLYPTSMEELFAIADAGELMPPKSTWFEPKLRSGLFIHEI